MMVNAFVYDNIVCGAETCIDSAADRCKAVALDGVQQTCTDVTGCSYTPFVGVSEACTAAAGASQTLIDTCTAVVVNGIAATCVFQGQPCDYQPKETTAAESCDATQVSHPNASDSWRPKLEASCAHGADGCCSFPMPATVSMAHYWEHALCADSIQ